MNKFIVIKLKSDWACSNVLDRVIEEGLKYVPFRGEKVHLFNLKHQSIILLSVENRKEGFTSKEHVYSPGSGAWFLFDGIPFLGDQNPQKQEWAERLYSSFREKGPEWFFENTMGTFGVVHIDEGGGITAFGDFSGLTPLFYFENEHLCAVSNRQMLLGRICPVSGAFSFDLHALSWLSGQSNIMGNASVFRGVKLLLPGEYLTVEPLTGIGRSRTFSTRFWHSRSEIAEDYSDRQLDDITENLLQQSRGLARLPTGSLTVDLTGGMDSRLVLALAVRSGLKDKLEFAQTHGPENSPEIQVARHIAALVDVPFRANVAAPYEMDLGRTWERLRYHVFHFEGTICPIDGLLDPARHSRLNLSGSGGELFRKHVKAHVNVHLKTLKETMDLFENYHQPTDPLGIQHHDVTVFQKQFMRDVVKQKYETGAELNDITDLVYVENRLGFWNGILLANVLGSIRIYPLVNFKATRTAYQVDYRQRQIDRVHFEVMRRVCEPLAKAPFLNKTWSKKLNPYIKRSSTAVAEAPFKTNVPFSMQATLPWSFEFIRAGWNGIVGLIEENPNSGIFEIIDREKFRRIIANPDDITKSISKVKQVFSLIEMQLLLLGDYLLQYEGNLGNEPELHSNVEGIHLGHRDDALQFHFSRAEATSEPTPTKPSASTKPPVSPEKKRSKQTPIEKIYYCNCCNGSFEWMLPAGKRENVRCPRCGSMERHRLLLFYLKEKSNLFTDNLKVLHVAPLEALKDALQKSPNIDYAHTEGPVAKGGFDAVICVHALDKCGDEAHATGNLYRTLKPGGRAFIMVPAHQSGQEIQKRLADAGFAVTADPFYEAFTTGERNRYALANDIVYCCQKPEDACATV